MKRPSPFFLSMPVRIFWFLCYCGLFFWEWLRAILDVIYRLIRPAAQVRPGIVKVGTTLTSETALTFLAVNIMFMPGLGLIDIDKANGIIYIHRLSIPGDKDADDLPEIKRCAAVLQKVFQ